MRFDGNRSEFFTFNPKSSGTQGENGFFQLNVGGAREVVISTSQGSSGQYDWVITDLSYNALIDAGTGFFKEDAGYLPIYNGGMGNLTIHSNDEFLNVCINPNGKGTTFLHVWVIR
tara:strand:- start:730 stop:1077 length:348 start_codon:yes stop_codon:yes gene_type:complete